MEHIQSPGMNSRQSQFRPAIGESAQLKSELILLKRKLNRMTEKEKRIQVRIHFVIYTFDVAGVAVLHQDIHENGEISYVSQLSELKIPSFCI